MEENLLMAQASPWTPLGELIELPQIPYSWWGLASCSLPVPKNPTPTLGPLGLGLWPFRHPLTLKIGGFALPTWCARSASVASRLVMIDVTSCGVVCLYLCLFVCLCDTVCVCVGMVLAVRQSTQLNWHQSHRYIVIIFINIILRWEWSGGCMVLS